MTDNPEKPTYFPELVSAREVVEAETAALTDMQIATAKKYPRDIAKFQADVFALAGSDQKTAVGCVYPMTRKGKDGTKTFDIFSVRLAEIVAAKYKNLRVASKIVAVEDKVVVAQAVCIDLENNYAAQVEVRRRITTSDGRRYGEDMIAMTANAATSIAFRNAIFKTVPRAFLKDAIEKIKGVARGSEKDLGERRAALIKYFAALGIKEKQILKSVGKTSLTEIGLDDLAELQGVAAAIKDGETTCDEAFPVDTEEAPPIPTGRQRGRPPKTTETHTEKKTAPTPAPVAEKPQEPLNEEMEPPEGEELFQK